MRDRWEKGDRQQTDRRLETGFKTQKKRDRRQAGNRRRETGDGRQAREGVKRQERGDMGKTEEGRRETRL